MTTNFHNLNQKLKSCAIMQPTYLSWVGYFGLISQVKVFVFFDHVQVVKRYWDVRNRIKTAQGELYLTVPVQKNQSRDDTTFNTALIQYSEPWTKKHIKSIEQVYSKTPHFNSVMNLYSEVLSTQPQTLADLNIKLIETFSSGLGFNPKFVRSSQMQNLVGSKDELLVSICKNVGSDLYLSPRGAAVYIEATTPGGNFMSNNIELFYQNYEHPTYPQLYGEFLPYMCVLDLLMNCGFEQGREYILSGNRPPTYYKDLKLL